MSRRRLALGEPRVKKPEPVVARAPAPLPAATTLAYASGAAEPARAAPVPPTRSGQKIEGRLPAMSAAPAAPVAPPEPPSRPEVAQAKPLPVARPVEPEPVREAAAAKAGPTSPWVIQLAAEDNEGKARDLLDQAKAASGRVLAKAAPFTERVMRGGATLYRARFSGFAEADTAQEACKNLKSRGFACFATRS